MPKNVSYAIVNSTKSEEPEIICVENSQHLAFQSIRHYGKFGAAIFEIHEDTDLRTRAARYFAHLGPGSVVEFNRYEWTRMSGNSTKYEKLFSNQMLIPTQIMINEALDLPQIQNYFHTENNKSLNLLYMLGDGDFFSLPNMSISRLEDRYLIRFGAKKSITFSMQFDSQSIGGYFVSQT